MNRGNKALTSAVGSVLFFAASYVTALAFLTKRDWFGAGDLPAFRFWTGLAAGVIFPVLVLLAWVSRRWPTLGLLIVASIGGLLSGYFWTVVVAAFLGHG